MEETQTVLKHKEILIFFLLKKWQSQRHRDKTKICTELNSSVLFMLLCSCLPQPSQASPVTLCNSFFPLFDWFFGLFGFFFGMCCFYFSVGFIWLFWLVRHCCFLPSYFHNACFKRNSLGLCTRSFLCSFQWQNGANQQFLNGHVTIPGEPNRTKCLSEKNFLGFNHRLHTVEQSVGYSFKPLKLITVEEGL